MKLPMHSTRWTLLICMLPVSITIAFAAGLVDASSPSSEIGDENKHTVLLIAYVLLALIFSFLCSIAEAVLLSITPSYIEGAKEGRPRRARLLRKLKLDKIDQSLAAILTLNTIAHTVGSIGAGAQATILFGSAWFGVFSAVMTLMILFLSEIVPKTLGAVYWPKLVGFTVLFIHSLIIILYPLVWVSEKITRLIARDNNPHGFSREEFIAMTRIGERSGDIDLRESRIIRNLFHFGLIKISDIMTPRTVISALPQELTVGEALKDTTESPFSRLPLYDKDLDHITGFVLKDDVLLYKARHKDDVKLASLKRDILTVPDSISLSVLLEKFLEHRQHIAIVANEYGSVSGLVTLEDLVETLMGMEIMDETDNVEDMRVLARKQWEKRARALGLENKT